ncbi:hypothetical protein CN445_26415 [Bacillus cereus]|uniref:hypothetical protein n=1 Tax=Bacillus TaxID=1386 RepID=UPI000BF49328|nr:hypothetical protein [Bacillus nitratireducens]PEW83198.1 hypothetical protein CN445_26415 [Bacillus cereus]PFN78922.1 hypothetical protein COJ62_03440 [Bacillus cereus]HDR3890658.1 hypothetical protein [Bacillus cereus]HDR7612944.1 hypothetical protein [Bacillus mycoides]
MKLCLLCNEQIEPVNRMQLRKLKEAATDFEETDKKEMKNIKIRTLQLSNQKICEYCYLKELARLTTIMRMKTMA